MALADDLKSLKTRSNNNICGVAALFKTLKGAELESFKTALETEGIPHTDLEKVLRANGYVISANTIGRHRRNVCRCSI